VRSKAQGEDAHAIRSATDQLRRAVQKIGAVAHQGQVPATESGQAPATAAASDVVDGEVRG
jgi:hypothetical protein